ncbi:MAG: TrbC/VirB2 family protein, partial [Campylobacter sp.]|nr:TrbC/VirB2 family protein [Campylobacter sp.]
ERDGRFDNSYQLTSTSVATTKNYSKLFQLLFVVFALSCVIFPDVAFAAGGLTKAKTLLETVADWLQILAVVTVTIAILVVGYKVLFGGQTIRECTPIIIGGLLIASASEIASLLMG